MSRCFPFPPPGYESKPRPDDGDVNLIIKEKKQKKHKDKKDKDKKKKKERKEKERTEGKHKDDKKRKREKHKDKKEKKKDNVSSLEEKKTVGSLENQNDGGGEKLVSDNKPSTDRIEDKRAFFELGNRVRNDGALDHQIVRKIILVEKPKVNFSGKGMENNGRMVNGQSLRVDAKSLGNGLVGKVEDDSCQVDKDEKKRENGGNGLVEKKREKGGNGLVGKVEGDCWRVDKVEKQRENGKERNGKERNGYRKKFGEGEGHENEERNKNAKAEEKRRKEEMKKVDKRRKEKTKKEKVTGISKEKVKQGSIDDKFLELHANSPSDLVTEGLNVSSYENGIRPNNISRPALLSPQVGQENRIQPNNVSRPALMNPQVGQENGIRPNDISRPVLQCHQAGQKCHQTGQNGSGLHTPQNIMNLAVEKKVVSTNQKVKLSSPQSVINGRNMEPCQTANKSVTELNNVLISSHLVHIKRKIEPCQTSKKVPLLENGGKMAMQGSNALHKTDKKEMRINGTLEGKDVISSRPSSAKMTVKAKVDASMKPPHPDLKYLGQILSVPQVEWAQCGDDQEWLFGCKDSQAKRPKLASPQNLVWAEAMLLESADIIALPYVIPY